MTQAPRLISADSHVGEPADLWLERISPRYRAIAPRLESRADSDYWLVEGIAPSPAGLMISVGKASEDLSKGRRYSEAPRGSWDPEARLPEIEHDHVFGEVIYPTVAMRFYRVDDLDYQDACIRAYNEWITDFCRSHPDRYKGLGMATVQNVALGVAQLQQVKSLGLAGALIAIAPDEDKPYSHADYEPFWETTASLGLPLSLHVHTGRRGPRSNKMVEKTLNPHVIQRTVAELIFGGVFERHPQLRVVSAENDASWAANFEQRMDYAYRRHRFVEGFSFQQDVLPSKFFRQNVFCTFMDDRSAFVARDEIGLGNIMWSSDYPHTDSTWPNSLQIIAENSAGVPEADVQQIVCGNASMLYGF